MVAANASAVIGPTPGTDIMCQQAFDFVTIWRTTLSKAAI